MHPLGCFGSTLAFDAKNLVCRSCSGMAACEAKVVARHPQMQKLLSRFSDAQGNPVSIQWMTVAEKKQWKAEQKAQALAEAEQLTYGDRQVATDIKSKVDNRAHALINRLSFDGINLLRADLDQVAAASPSLGTIIAALRANGRTTMHALTTAVAQSAPYSDGTAEQYAYLAVSILTSCDRAQRVGPVVELT